MATAVETKPPLFEAIRDAVATDDTPFEGTECPEPGTLLVRSERCRDLTLVATAADTDPHSRALIRTAHRRARAHGTTRFATVNPTDLFVFSPAQSGTLDRVHYDLRGRSLDSSASEFLGALSTPVESSTEAVLLGRLRSFHASLARRYEERLAERFGRDEQVTALVRSWATDYGHPPAEAETVQTAARQYAYARLNRVLCYELLRTQTGDSLERLTADCSAVDLDDRLDEQFASAIDVWGCAEIFRIDSPLAQAIPEDERTRRCRYEFLQSLEAEPLACIDGDILGQLYEAVVPAAARTELGQFYTPDTVGTILAGWAIQSADDRVLDPCSGSGALTVAASDRLAELAGAPDRTGSITAVDIESVPIQLTALNHRRCGGPTGELSTYCVDFFDLEPGDDSERCQSADGSAPPTVGPFDATVANPPYVRQEAISDERAHFRSHLSAFGADDSEIPLDRRSDLYCYFLTHATRFLADGARLAWIVPTKWLTADYGTAFQRFLFDHYSVESIVCFRESLFDDALVDTVLLLAQRCDSEPDRQATETEFVRIDEQLSASDVLDTLARERGLGDGRSLAIESDAESRTVTVRQSSLADRIGEKLQPYLSAPSIYIALCEHDDCLPLAERAAITRGVKTGANPIFLLDRQTIDSYGVDRRFCRPAIKTVRAVDGFEYATDDAERWLLDLHDYVTSHDADSGDAIRERLRMDGYDGVAAYLSWADDQPARDNSSLESYEPWFDMGGFEGSTAPIICPQAMDTRRFFARTDSAVVPSNRFLLVEPAEGVDETLLLGLLNSSLSQIVVESHGRVTGGGAINLSGSDLDSFPILDPDVLSPTQATTITEGFERLAAGDASGRDAIDRTVIEALGLDVSVSAVQELSQALKQSRRRDDPTDDSLPDAIDAIEGRIELSFE